MENPQETMEWPGNDSGFLSIFPRTNLWENIKLEQPGQTFRSIDGRLFFEM